MRECAGQRSRELNEYGEAVTAFTRFEDTVRIKALDEASMPLYGAIDEKVIRRG